MAVEFERFCNYLYSAFVVCAYVCTDTVFLPLVVTLCFGFLTIRLEDTTVLDFIRYAVKYFISTQQEFIWAERREK